MKAKVIKTGEIYNIPDYSRLEVDACDSYGTPLSFGFDEVEIIHEIDMRHAMFISCIDWEQRRYEIAKEVLSTFIANNLQKNCEEKSSWSTLVEDSLNYADELIKQLKNK